MGTVESDGLAELFSAFLDGEVDQRERAYVERMLESDPNARTLLQELRATSAAIGALPRHRAPASIEEDILNRLERSDLLTGLTESSPSGSDRLSGYRAFTAMAAMVGLVIISAFLYYSDWNDVNPRTPDRSPNRVVEAQPAKPILDKAIIEDKILQGVKLASLTSHPFANETVRLQVSVGDRAERDSLSARLMSRLAKQHIANLVDLDRAGQKANAKTTFYYRGRPSVNFEDTQQSQILVRVPASTLDELLDVIASDTGSTERVTLAAGGLTFRGRASARKTLRQLSGASSLGERVAIKSEAADEHRPGRLADATVKTNHPAPHPAPRVRSKKKVERPGLFDDILDAFGLPRDLLEPGAETQSYALGDSNTRSAKTDHPGKIAIAKQKKQKKADAVAARFHSQDAIKLQKSAESSADKIASLNSVKSSKKAPHDSASLAARESSGLVARRIQAMKGRRVRGAASPSVSVAKRVVPKPLAKRQLKSLAKHKPSALTTKGNSNSKTKPRQAKVDPKKDPLVTLVIQLMPVQTSKPPVSLKQPISSKPTASKKAPIQAKKGGKPAVNSQSTKTKSDPRRKPLG